VPDLHGRVAIVTGAGQGIGRGVTLALAAAGAAVVAAGRTASTLEETCTEVRSRGPAALPVVCDVRRLADIERCVARTVDEFGRLDILVNNAQTYRHALLLDATEEDMQATWASGPLAVFRSMRVAYPHLKQRRGVIVNFGSGAQLMHDGRLYSVYAAAKSAIESLTRYAAVEWGADGIRVVLVMPAARSAGVEAFERRDPARYQEMLGRIPAGRFGDAELDIGRPVAWLVSDEAGYITGSTIMLDGGQMFVR
jgi:NAD(P)-dependent dehydrogenase (short-subunit alcohol dehydrogenase family)